MKRLRPLGIVLGLFVILVLGTAACSGATPAGPSPTPVVLVVTATPAPAASATTPGANATAPATASVPAAGGTPAAGQSGSESIKGAASSGGTVSSGTTTVALPASSGSKVEASALWAGSDGSKAIGGISRVRVAAEKGSNKELRVGFFEEEVGGSGPQWRAAGWMAVIMSSFLLGVDPTEFRYTYDIGGRADGPSAGALMTVATIASILGHTIKTDAAMTGTINPDGTVGPVGGIPHKIDGAAAAKKKLVLIPAGQRNDVDMNEKRSVDVIERGKRQGVEVREVSDIYEAYELLTGKPLLKPDGMKEVRPELPSVSYERAKSKAKEWYARYSQYAQQYNSQPMDYQFDFTDEVLLDAKKAGDKADSYYGQGMASASYRQALNAALGASIAFNTSKVVQTYIDGGVDRALSYLSSMASVKTKIDALADRLQSQSASSLGDVLVISESYGNLILAKGLEMMADSKLNGPMPNDEDELVQMLAEAVLWYGIADQAVEVAKDSMDIGLGQGKAPMPQIDRVQSLADLFRRAAEANLNYFDTIVLNEIAAGMGMHLDVVKASFAAQDLNYTFANSSLGAMNFFKERAGGGPSGAFATLGGSINSYVLSSTLVSKYYSLDAQVDQDGSVTGIGRERAMINMLDFAERRSKEYIGLATASGVEPVQAILNYDGAKVSREGDLDDKFNALSDFWTASLQSQIIGVLSGKAKIVR